MQNISHNEPEPRRLSKAPLVLFVILVTTAVPLLALAQEANDAEENASGTLDEIVVEGRLTRYSATKSNTPIMETARTVSIEARQQLIDKGALNLADTYLYPPGVFDRERFRLRICPRLRFRDRRTRRHLRRRVVDQRVRAGIRKRAAPIGDRPVFLRCAGSQYP